MTDTTLVTIVFIIHHRRLGSDLVSVHDMLMVEPLNFAEELRDLEHRGVLRGASQMLRSGFQPFKTQKIQRIMEIDLFLIRLKSAQLLYLINIRTPNSGTSALLSK